MGVFYLYVLLGNIPGHCNHAVDAIVHRYHIGGDRVIAPNAVHVATHSPYDNLSGAVNVIRPSLDWFFIAGNHY